MEVSEDGAVAGTNDSVAPHAHVRLDGSGLAVSSAQFEFQGEVPSGDG